MSYRYDKQKRARGRWYLVAAVLLVLALFTPVYSWVFDALERPLARTWERQGNTFSGTENFFQALYGKQEILEENEELRQQVARLEIDNLRTEYLSSQLEKVYAILELENTLVAQVIKTNFNGLGDTVIINRGTDDGLAVGDKVSSHDKVLIGYIGEVYETTARVQLYSHPEEQVEGMLFPHDVTLVAHGQGRGGFMIETPREVEVAEGDILYSLEQPGTIIAIVRSVVFDPRDPFKQVYLSYPTNINQIHLVGIKKNTL